MKQIAFIILITILMLGGIGFALADETITMTGGSGGRTVSITTNANVIAISPPARLVSISNAGSGVVYVAIRVNGTEFAAMVASTNATPVAASAVYEFVGGAPIDSIVLQSAADTTNAVSIGAQR